MGPRLLVGALALCATRTSAQVGHLPARSPYQDLEYKQEASFYGGFYNAGRDPAGVAPRDGPMLGMRYDLRIGGPAYLTVKAARVLSERRVIDPRLPEDRRLLGVRDWPLYLADVGISMNITGQKSYRRLVPVISGGLGIASDFKAGDDAGAFRFGTPFALSLGAGLKWTPGGRWLLRADATNHFYQIKYPDTYFTLATDGTQVLNDGDATRVWKANVALTFGASYLLFR